MKKTQNTVKYISKQITHALDVKRTKKIFRISNDVGHNQWFLDFSLSITEPTRKLEDGTDIAVREFF